jgi:hypothetical protein
VYWCIGASFGPDGALAADEIQYKMRPHIVNNSASAVSISIGKPSTLRLLVVGAAIPDRWKPPPATVVAGDKPVLVMWKGNQYWAIAPNAPGDAAISSAHTTVENGITYSVKEQEFATYWDGKLLAGNSVYWHPLRQQPDGKGVREGDLVFAVPKAPDTVVFGLAILAYDNGKPTVIQVAEKANWLYQVNENSF